MRDQISSKLIDFETKVADLASRTKKVGLNFGKEKLFNSLSKSNGESSPNKKNNSRKNAISI